MRPFFFGPETHRLYGVYQAPADPQPGGRAVLICAPFGQEAIRSHRALRVLADTLCRAGFHTLRFDVFGAGNSAGEGVDGRLDTWTQDTQWALETLKSISGARTVWACGLRLGASVAARAVTRGNAQALVLWDPIVDGQSWLSQRQVDAPGMVDGFPVSSGLLSDLNALKGSTLVHAQIPTRTLVIETTPACGLGALTTRLERHTRVDYRRVEAPACWTEENDFGAGPIPTAAINTIVGWHP